MFTRRLPATRVPARSRSPPTADVDRTVRAATSVRGVARAQNRTRATGPMPAADLCRSGSRSLDPVLPSVTNAVDDSLIWYSGMRHGCAVPLHRAAQPSAATADGVSGLGKDLGVVFGAQGHALSQRDRVDRARRMVRGAW